ncbi:hypothetical protein E8E12_009635 [Didymella heteroderae]|uniref:MFS general substrate transporter n=1 Tax=Didymella heteroderae TaxID=1769908 RepID=A0A9P5C1H5_9PLEO|nr:hypothetical protein E8E12_009635 [Didymella heteroderae]
MSLIQHVTQQEGTDREEALVDLLLARRQEPVAGDLDGGVTQYNVSTFKRAAQVLAVVLACWFASGIVFGFAALKPILIKEGVYRDLCTQEELDEEVEVCYEQDLRLNFFFSLASTTANVSALLVGTMLDRYGPRVCYLVGSACLAAGSIIMSLAFQIEEFDGYTIGNFFLALGGTFVFLPSFQIANAFPKYSGTIVALVTGAFDASAAVYLFYRLAYEGTDGAFKPQTFFLAYLIVPAAIVVAQLTFLPTENYKTAPQLEMKIQRAVENERDVHTSDEDLPDDEVWRRRKNRSARRRKRLSKLDQLIGDEVSRKKQEEKHEHQLETSGVWGALHNKTAIEQMLTPWFILLALLTVMQMVRMNYFIASIREQYAYMLGSIDLAARVNDFFDWALPLGGVLSTPFLGMLLDNVSTPGVLLIIVVIATAIGIIGSIATLWAGFVNVLLFVFMRPLYYSAMSDYATKVFGFATFGRVYGTIICFSGLINLSQTGIDALTKSTFNGNPVPVNAVLAGLTFVIGISLVVYVTVQSVRMRKKLDEEDAMTVTNTDVGSIMESLLEEDEPRDYGSVTPGRPPRDYEQPGRPSREYV